MKEFGLCPEGGDEDKDLLPEEKVALMAMKSDMKRRFNYNKPTKDGSQDSEERSPIGKTKTFKQIREEQIDQEASKLYIEFAIDITVLLIIVIILLVDRAKN